jgi:Family of unknown function (DUF5691)
VNATTPAWPDVLASALVGTARRGGEAESLLDTAAAQALRRRAGVALVHGAQPPPPAPAEDAPPVGPDAAARVDALLAVDSVARHAIPVRDTASRLELLAEWLSAAAAAGRRLPAELVPALLEVGRRQSLLRPLIAQVAGPLAGWLATQHADWSYAAANQQGRSTVDDPGAWELGPIGNRVAYLRRMRERDPAQARGLLASAWDSEPPDDRAALLQALDTGLSADDEPLLERALDDRRRQVRTVALDLLAGLPDSTYARRMSARAVACVRLQGPRRIEVHPPAECDASMRRDGIAPRPPAGTGERAWWLEEILARTPLHVWPEPRAFLARRVSEAWVATVYRGLARAAAAQRHAAWASVLADPLTEDVAARGHPDDRLLLEALYDALPPDDLAARATAALRRGLAGATAVGVEHVLALCPRPWSPAIAEAVLAGLAEQLGRQGAAWRITGLCELAALRLPADLAPRATELAERLRPNDPGATAQREGRSLRGPQSQAGDAVVNRFAATLRFRHEMLKELA